MKRALSQFRCFRASLPALSLRSRPTSIPRALPQGLSPSRIIYRTPVAQLRRYSGIVAEDFTDEEKELAKQRQETQKLSKASIQLKRIEELYHSACQHITDENWLQAEDKLNTILDLMPSKPGDETFLGRVLIHLAFVEQSIGKREKAQSHYEKGIPILKKTLGEDHYELAHTMLNYAEVLAFLTQVEEAEAISKQAVPIFEKHYGPQNEILGALLSNIGGYLCAQRKFEEAAPILLRALSVLENALGRKNEYTTGCLTNYARVLKKLDRQEQLDEIKRKYSSQLEPFTNLENLEKDELDPQMEARLAELAESKSFNPEGLFKSNTFHKKELREFITQWEKEHEGKLDPELIPALLEELEAMSEEEVSKACDTILRDLEQKSRQAETDPFMLNTRKAEEEEEEEEEYGESESDHDEEENIPDGHQVWRASEEYDKKMEQHTEIDLTSMKDDHKTG